MDSRRDTSSGRDLTRAQRTVDQPRPFQADPPMRRRDRVLAQPGPEPVESHSEGSSCPISAHLGIESPGELNPVAPIGHVREQTKKQNRHRLGGCRAEITSFADDLKISTEPGDVGHDEKKFFAHQPKETINSRKITLRKCLRHRIPPKLACDPKVCRLGEAPYQYRTAPPCCSEIPGHKCGRCASLDLFAPSSPSRSRNS